MNKYRNRKAIIDGIKFIAGFMYTETSTGETVVEEVKGVETKEFSIYKNMFRKGE